MRNIFVTLTIVLAAFALVGNAPGVADVKGSKDHPLISRYSGSEIIGYEKKAFDGYRLVLGPHTRDANNNIVPKKKQDLEGRVTRILYKSPKGRSTLEVYRNYEKALKSAGFETMFSCSGDGCGSLFKYTVADALTKKHGVSPSRLTPKGVGMLAPVASNSTESGRAKNRRVELVEK